MNNQQKDMFRDLLNKEKARIEKGIRDMVSSLKTTEHDATGDSIDEAAALSETSMSLRFKERDKKLLAKVNLALKRIEDGSFGECMDCGEFIGTRRLKSRPVTTLCIVCKEKQERYEKEHREYV